MNRETEGRDTFFANDVDGLGAFSARIKETKEEFRSIQTPLIISKNNEFKLLLNQS